MPADVTDASFEAEVLRSTLPVLVDFWAPYCASCRAMMPIVDQLAAEYAGRLKVVKLDADASPESPTRLGVKAVPNFIFVKGGKVVDQILGAVPKKRLVDAIERALAG